MSLDGRHCLGVCDPSVYVAQSHTPQARCVRFGRAVTGRARNTRYEAPRQALPRRVRPPLDPAGFSPAHADFVGIRANKPPVPIPGSTSIRRGLDMRIRPSVAEID